MADRNYDMFKMAGWHITQQAEGFRLNAPGGSFWPCRESAAAAWADLPEAQQHWETECPKREDTQHCDHWYDGGECCSCGDGPEASS